MKLWLAGWAVIVAELIAILWLGWLYSQHLIVISVEKGADVATLVLTAAAVVVTGVGVAVAVVTIWGFSEIKGHAITAAVAAAEKAVQGTRRDAFNSGQAAPAGDEANKIAEVVDEKERPNAA